MSLNVIIEHTADGSDTLFVPELNEHYHSVNGAVQESMHVFIDAGLRKICDDKKILSILEVGFGTGLNALLTLQEGSIKNLSINYTGIELHPLPNDVIEALSTRTDENLQSDFNLIHHAEWNNGIYINPNFLLKKITADFCKLDFCEENQHFDLIYFDAFAPDKQNEMWSQENFNYLYKHTSQEGILSTYCAKGSVRRMLQQAGYTVERLAGPPGKREMLRASKI